MATKLLDRDEFRAWLVENQDNEVGKGIYCFECPLARFLGGKVTKVKFKMNKTGDWVPLPKWARNFVKSLDDNFHCRSVRGADALRILDTIGE